MSQQWEVVGGGDKGGIIVREGQSTSSQQASERLSTGAVIEEVELAGERLQYKKVTGTGPNQGWVSIRLKDKELIVKLDREVDDEKKMEAGPDAAATDTGEVGWYSGKPVVSGRKIRIACLHGTSSSTTIMSMQLGRLKMLWKDKVEFIFIQGNIKTKDVDPDNKELAAMEKSFPGQDFWQYMVCPDQKVKDHMIDYEDMEKGVAYIQSHLRENAPIDGIFGFSQGSNIATVLAAMAIDGDGAPLAFTIQSCGGGPGWMHRYPDKFQSPLRIPSFHISGNEDWVTDNTDRKYLRREAQAIAIKLFTNPIVTEHSGDHRPLPKDPKEIAPLAERILAFMESAVT